MTNKEIIDKIKAEIERRLNDYWKICFHDVKAYSEDSNVRELKEILSFIRTLEESEKPMQEGLEEEIEAYFDSNFGTPWDGCHPIGVFELDSMARHFAEWGAEHLKK